MTLCWLSCTEEDYYKRKEFAPEKGTILKGKNSLPFTVEPFFRREAKTF